MKFGERLRLFFKGKSAFNQEDMDALCDLLIEGDFGAAQAYKMTEILEERCKKDNTLNLSDELSRLLEDMLLNDEIIKGIYNKNVLQFNKFSVILLLGVNGVGKTTTAAKLSHLISSQYNKKTILAAADTFRAAAIDQLKIHGQKLDTRVVAHKQGGDPAAVVYDALEAAFSGGIDAVIADTAGRMHTKSALVEELRKIDRVVESKASGVKELCYLKYLVLDATTGRNALAQAETFHSAVNLDGVILTKYDSTARGGIVFSLASELKLPVIYICTGEKYTDISIFDPHKFSKEFAGIE